MTSVTDIRKRLESRYANTKENESYNLEKLGNNAHFEIYRRLYTLLGVTIVPAPWREMDSEVDDLIRLYEQIQEGDQALMNQRMSYLDSKYKGITLKAKSAWSTFIDEWNTYVDTHRPINQQA